MIATTLEIRMGFHRRRFGHRPLTMVCALALSAGILTTGTALARPMAVPQKYFIDCSGESVADEHAQPGTRARPFTSLAQINQRTLRPGSQVYLARGMTCQGTLVLNDSGTAARPVRVDAYGDPDRPAPRIDAAGAQQAVLVSDAEYVHVTDLELTAPGDNSAPRRGVYVLAKDTGPIHGIELRGLAIHDVRGVVNGPRTGNGKFGAASGGIVVEAQGTTTPTWYENLRIEDNNLRAVDREGIYTWSNWCRRPELGDFWDDVCDAPYAPSRGTIIRGNRLSDIGGDGIAVKMNNNALVEHNTLAGFNMRSGTYNAGMWTANSEDVTFQYNEASGGHTTLDGMAWDVDHATRGIVYQYNLSHDNEGGWLLLCPTSTGIRDFVVRYNISINDRFRGVENCSGHIASGAVHNNTVYIGDGVSQVVVNENNSQPRQVDFANNIIHKQGTGTASFRLRSGRFAFDHNLFYGVPQPPGAAASVLADPLFEAPGTNASAGYHLRATSPALGAGSLVPDTAAHDFFHTPVPQNEPPTIGAAQQ
ncbi:hypothetical protein [Streptomyces sp. NPDC057580]|uniref:hypothetical protein n=1 Tax=Streptomyces sp. NPDC057580 TaxID=3346173 RepID=UPI0036823D1B